MVWLIKTKMVFLFYFFRTVRGDVYPHITQIGAGKVDIRKHFSQYDYAPKASISSAVERVTKILMSTETTMMVYRIPVVCVSHFIQV